MDEMLTMAPWVPLPHLGEHGQGGVQRRPEMGVQRLFVVLEGHQADGPHLDHPGVVDEDFDGSQPVPDLADHPLHLPLVREVARHRHHLGPAFLQVRPRVFQFLRVAHRWPGVPPPAQADGPAPGPAPANRP